MSEPLVTTTIVVHNGERFLAEAIESALAQDYRVHEVLVVDDGSTDRSAAIAAGYEDVRVIRAAWGGEGAARNLAIEAARGDVIAILDSDDTMLPGRIRTQVEALDDERYGCVLGLQELVREQGPTPDWSQIPRLPAPDSPEAGPNTNPVYQFPTLAIRREWCERIGPFEPSLKLGTDSDWLMRGFETGLNPRFLDIPLIRRRLHDANLSGDEATMNRMLPRLFQRRIERHRGDA